MADRGWLCISKDRESLVRAGDGYEEILGDYYVWDSTVQRSDDIQKDDVIAIWNDRDGLLGASWVEDIDIEQSFKIQHHCPLCKKTDVRKRKVLTPSFRCASCRAEFDEPKSIEIPVKVFRARYSAGWVPVETSVSAAECRLLSINPKSQHSLRELDLTKFHRFIASLPARSSAAFNRRDKKLNGGHRLRTVKTRIGQGEFRTRLREKFGDVCAISGPNHQSALDAAHLYSYSEVGTHHEDGGLLLRRDIHRLFDLGLIAIEPDHLVVDIHDDLKAVDQYSLLEGWRLSVEINKSTKSFLALHWEQFRSAQSVDSKP